MVRFKNRYITFKITLGDKSDKSFPLKLLALHHAINQKVHQMYGDFGSAAIKSGFNAKYCNARTRIALVKTRHGPHKFLLKALPEIKDIAGRAVSVKILYIGATLKHCFLFIKKYQQQKLEEIWYSLKTEMERRKMHDCLMSLTLSMKEYTQHK